MKKKIFYPVIFSLLVLFSLSFKSCSKFESINSTPSEVFDNKIVSLGKRASIDNTSSKKISKHAFMLGISELSVNQVSLNTLKVKINATNSIVNNRKIMLNGEELYIEKSNDDSIYIITDRNNNSRIEYNYKDANFSFFYKESTFSSLDLKNGKKLLSSSQNLMFVKLLIIYEQIIGNVPKATYGEWVNNINPDETYSKEILASASSCTRYNISFGFTRSEADWNAKQDRTAFLTAYPTCQQIGEIDITCVLTLSPCVATVTFKCTGAICNSGVITE